jgi:hypothetical protein
VRGEDLLAQAIDFESIWRRGRRHGGDHLLQRTAVETTADGRDPQVAAATVVAGEGSGERRGERGLVWVGQTNSGPGGWVKPSQVGWLASGPRPNFSYLKIKSLNNLFA